MGKKRNFIPKQNTHDLLVGTLSIGIPSFKMLSFMSNNQWIISKSLFEFFKDLYLHSCISLKFNRVSFYGMTGLCAIEPGISCFLSIVDCRYGFLPSHSSIIYEENNPMVWLRTPLYDHSISSNKKGEEDVERRTKLKKRRKTTANALRIRFALLAKCRVPLAWLIKRLLCRLVPSRP